MTFNTWIDTFTTEKGLDMDRTFTVEGASGPNYIPLGCVVEAIKSASKREQDQIKTTIVKIDFMNGDVCHLFNHLAKALAI